MKDQTTINNIKARVMCMAGRASEEHIADAVFRSVRTVQDYAYKMGLSLATVKVRWTEEAECRLIEMKRMGASRKEMSSALGRSTQAINFRLVKLKKRRPPCLAASANPPRSTLNNVVT